jgi:hypothetical protein
MVERHKRRVEAIAQFRRLGHYVEGACNNDLQTLVSSGFVPASTHQRSSPQPPPTPSIVKIEQARPASSS